MKKIMQTLIVVLCASLASIGCSGDKGPRPFTVMFMPKLTGIPYFTACKLGAEEAAKELGIELVYDGATKADANEQTEMLEQRIASGSYDAFAVACNDPTRVATALKEARNQNKIVVTYDADCLPEARQFFVNMATYDAVAEEMVEVMAEQLEPKGVGKVGILTSHIDAPNQSEWAKRIKAYAKKKYPKMTILGEETHGEDREKGITRAKAMILAHEDLKGIIGLTSIAVPAAAEAVFQEGKKGKIVVTGVSTPRDMKKHVENGTVKEFILWSPIDLGYLTVHVVNLIRQGKMPKTGTGTIQAGRLGDIEAKDFEVLLGKPLRFNKDNIDKYDF